MNGEVMKNSFVRVVEEVPELERHLLKHIGSCLEVKDGKVLYRDFQGKTTIWLPMNIVKVEEVKDCIGKLLNSGDTVWVAVKNEMRKCAYIGATKWKFHGYSKFELGCQLKDENGKKFSHFHTMGRLKV